MPEQELVERMAELGFEHTPDLPGSPDFAHFGYKIALAITSEDAYRALELNDKVAFNLEFRKRFSTLSAKHWYCWRIHEEDSVDETIDFVNGIIIKREAAKVHLPDGDEPKHKKLISRLKQTDDEILVEERKRRRNRPLLWGLIERRKDIEQRLHVVLKPVILTRDDHKCRVCGSKEDLELARIIGADAAKPERISKKRVIWVYPDAEKRWSEDNLLILCNSCHKAFDSFRSRMARRGLDAMSIEQAVDYIKNRFGL